MMKIDENELKNGWKIVGKVRGECGYVVELEGGKKNGCYDFRQLDNRRQSKDQEFSSMSCSRMQVC